MNLYFSNMIKRVLVSISVFFISVLTLSGCQNHKVDGNKVYYLGWNEAVGDYRLVIEGADAPSFKELAKADYGADRHSVYYMNLKLPNADPHTFTFLNDNYGRDKRAVYFQEKVIKGADPSSFELVGDGPYGRDKTDYYFDSLALNVDNVKNFRILNSVDRFSYWAKDGHSYYILATKYPLYDYNGFEVIGNGYAKDKFKVYFRDSIVENADPKTFKTSSFASGMDKNSIYSGNRRLSIKHPSSYTKINSMFGKDKFYVYHQGEILTGADPETFQILSWNWERDKINHYYQGKVMSNIDHNSFVLLQNNYAKDRNQVYYYDKVVAGADPSTFSVDEFTFIGKDKFGCYENGVKVKCDTSK